MEKTVGNVEISAMEKRVLSKLDNYTYINVSNFYFYYIKYSRTVLYEIVWRSKISRITKTVGLGSIILIEVFWSRQRYVKKIVCMIVVRTGY